MLRDGFLFVHCYNMWENKSSFWFVQQSHWSNKICYAKYTRYSWLFGRLAGLTVLIWRSERKGRVENFSIVVVKSPTIQWTVERPASKAQQFCRMMPNDIQVAHIFIAAAVVFIMFFFCSFEISKMKGKILLPLYLANEWMNTKKKHSGCKCTRLRDLVCYY